MAQDESGIPTIDMWGDGDGEKKEEGVSQNEQSKEDVQNEEQSLQEAIPSGTNILDLPSEGKLGYPSQVTYRDILAEDEEILASATADTYARTLNGVIKSVLNDCEFFEQMCIHDRDFLVVWLWANNYTATKDVDVKCGGCSKEDHVRVDLTNLPQNPIHESFKGYFEMTLKKTGTPVRIRLNTVGDENEVEKFLSVPANKNYRFDHLMRVFAIELGVNMPLTEKIKWVGNNVTAKEMGLIKQFHNKFAFGLKPTFEHECSGCGEVAHVDIPFQTEDILFPTVSADIEEFL